MVPPSPAESLRLFSVPRPVVSAPRLALHIALFALTLLTTTIVGVGLARSFRASTPVDLDRSVAALLDFPRHPGMLAEGLPFSLTLLIILLAHEMGHYLTCVHYRIDASLPYFIPAPTLIGTFGAFIRIRSPIYTKRALFDVGVAGPIAGFVVLLPALAVGVASSKVIHGIANQGDLIFGTPLILRAVEWAIFPGVPSSDIYLHPIARAAWAGVLATALNLLPIGQLDGGHILYSFVGDVHKRLSKLFVVLLVGMAAFSSWKYDNFMTGLPWLFWAVLLALFALRHPTICDMSPMDAARVRIGWLALAILLVSFTLAPVRIAGG